MCVHAVYGCVGVGVCVCVGGCVRVGMKRACVCMRARVCVRQAASSHRFDDEEARLIDRIQGRAAYAVKPKKIAEAA